MFTNLISLFAQKQTAVVLEVSRIAHHYYLRTPAGNVHIDRLDAIRITAVYAGETTGEVCPNYDGAFARFWSWKPSGIVQVEICPE